MIKLTPIVKNKSAVITDSLILSNPDAFYKLQGRVIGQTEKLSMDKTEIILIGLHLSIGSSSAGCIGCFNCGKHGCPCYTSSNKFKICILPVGKTLVLAS